VTHLWRATPWRWLLASAVAAMTIASCSSPSPTPKPSPRSSSTAHAAATPSLVTGNAGDPALLPVQSPIPVVQASSTLIAEWRPYADGLLTLIPDTSVPYSRPAVPPLADGTGGAVDQPTEHRWAEAFMREQAWENWSIDHAQLDFVTGNVISAAAAETGLYLPEGATTLRITGTRWPSAVRIVRVPQPAASSPPLSASDGYAVLATFQQGWAVVAVFPDGHTEPLSQQIDDPGETDFFIGHLDASKRQLGELWFATVAGNCGGHVPAVVAQLCSE
jgi:hypothetical protein